MNYFGKKAWLERHGVLHVRGGGPRRSSWKSHGGCVLLSWAQSEIDIVDGLYRNVKEALWLGIEDGSS